MTDAEIETIIAERLQGKSVRAIAKQLKMSIDDVNTTLDGLAEEITPRFKLRAIAIDLHRLDAHYLVFDKRAREEGDVNSGELCLKILARKAAIIGSDAPVAQRLDVVALQNLASPPPSSIDKIEAALKRLAITGPPAASSENSEQAANANGSLNVLPR